MKRPGRTILRIFVFLLLGMIVNVVVAGALAAFGRIPRSFADPFANQKTKWPFPPPHLFPPFATSVDTDNAFGVSCSELFALTDTPRNLKRAWRTHELMGKAGDAAGAGASEMLALQEGSLEATQEGEQTAHMRMQTIACGFPQRSFTGVRWHLKVFDSRGGSTQTETLNAFESSISPLQSSPLIATAGGGGEKRLIPFRPLWPGFAINTIFYAALLWAIFCAPGKIRRFVRIRRGCCPACAYPVGASPICTECGNPLQSTNVES